jgi:hypothetical protein
MTDNLGFEDTNYMIDPLVLEIYLNKGNYKDRLLINDLKRKAQIFRLPDLDESSFFVQAEEVEDILYTKYKKDILNFDSTAPSVLAATANSIFFIEAAMREFKNLRYFRVNVSNNENKTPEKPTPFDYRIIHSRIDMANNCHPEFLVTAKQIFKEIGVYSPSVFNPKPYFEISVRDLFLSIEGYYLQFDPESEEYLDAMDLIMVFGPKLEKDDSTVLVIMEK